MTGDGTLHPRDLAALLVDAADGDLASAVIRLTEAGLVLPAFTAWEHDPLVLTTVRLTSTGLEWVQKNADLLA